MYDRTFPGLFPTDLQAQIEWRCSVPADGHFGAGRENLCRTAFMHAPELIRMGHNM